MIPEKAQVPESNQKARARHSTREKGEGDIVEEEEEVLKRRIAGHPLYGLLLENHTDCLKVGLGEIGDQIGDKSTTTMDNNIVNAKQFIKDATSSDPDSSDLDQFMEMTSFITAMYAQLEDLSGSKKKPLPTRPAGGDLAMSSAFQPRNKNM
ncbi:hypothetical protein C1H46_023997 [Malus baccata]|uniref:KNOX1 domain-containing protein n=1 Tax=Malus baccata TaxID=106549 RepID=A0A540LVN8_MALBA|nr:hypothetical protein C1H46_023997 [Malus baccata]